MSTIFERLQKKLEIEKKDEGISPLDLAELPQDLRKLMRFMLREVEITAANLHTAVADMPDVKLTPKELDDALLVLSRQGWVIQRGEGQNISYLVNLQRKRARNIWAILAMRIEKSEEDKEP
jgi:hypothetical protein